jgi:hypothetical protein
MASLPPGAGTRSGLSKIPGRAKVTVPITRQGHLTGQAALLDRGDGDFHLRVVKSARSAPAPNGRLPLLDADLGRG